MSKWKKYILWFAHEYIEFRFAVSPFVNFKTVVRKLFRIFVGDGLLARNVQFRDEIRRTRQHRKFVLDW
jgi:hypothetical protein